MDLVEIRKKANKKKKQGSANASSPEPPVETPIAVDPDPVDAPASIPSATEGSVADVNETKTAQLVEPMPEDVATRAYDALESLFMGQDNLSLATEESYLQALQGSTVEIDQSVVRWLSFALAKEEYAVNIEQVKEIIKPREITDIPRVPDYLLGVISLRGIVIPVIDLRLRLNLGAVGVNDKNRIIVCEQQDRIVGLLVDSITQVVQVREADIEPPPAILSGLDRDMVEGVGRIQGQMIILLDLVEVLNMEMN